MNTVFIDIQNKLSRINGFKYIGEDWGQLNFEQPPVDFPCGLIDLGDVVYSSITGKAQQAKGTLNVTVADCRYNGDKSALPEKETDQAFKIFDLIKDVHKALHGTGGPEYSPLERKSVKKILREDGVREFLITFEFGFTDISAVRQYEKASVPSAINIK